MFTKQTNMIQRAAFSYLKRLYSYTSKSKLAVLMKDIEGLLRIHLKYFILSELIFQNRLNLNLKFFLNVGVLNVLFLGLAVIADLLKILNICLFLKKTSSIFLMLTYCLNGYENKFLLSL